MRNPGESQQHVHPLHNKNLEVSDLQEFANL
jgi:hypothetical protein